MEWIMYLIVGCMVSVVAALVMFIVVFSIAWSKTHTKRYWKNLHNFVAYCANCIGMYSFHDYWLCHSYPIQLGGEIDGMDNGYHSRNYVTIICGIDDIHSNKDTYMDSEIHTNRFSFHDYRLCDTKITEVK